MKAILVKYLPATNTKPTRLKVSATTLKPLIYSVHEFDSNSVDCIELQAAKKFANHFNWLDKNELVIGQLPSLDYVAVLVAK